MAASSCALISSDTANASLVGCTTIAVQFSSGTRASVASDAPWLESTKISWNVAADSGASSSTPASGSGLPWSASASATIRFFSGSPWAMSRPSSAKTSA